MVDLSSVVKESYNEGDEKYCFDTVPLWKIILLSTVTFGLYEIVWFYKTWKRLRCNFGYDVNSFFRAWFAPITNFWLFSVLDKYIKCFDRDSFPAVLFAILYLLANFSHKLPDPGWLLYVIPIFLITVIQDKLNKINEQYYPGAKLNGWNVQNTFWAIPCGLLFVLAMIGTFMAD